MPCFYHCHYEGRTVGSRKWNTTLYIKSLPQEMPEHELVATLLMGRARRTPEDEGRYLWSWGNTQVVARNTLGKYTDTRVPVFLSNGNAFLKFNNWQQAVKWYNHMRDALVNTTATGRTVPRKAIIEWARKDMEACGGNSYPTRPGSLGAKWSEEAWRVDDLYYAGPPSGLAHSRYYNLR